MNTRLTETLVGFGVLAVAIGFAIYTANAIGTNSNRNHMEIHAKFASLGSGISSGADIRVAGVKVGSVSQITLDSQTYEAEVTLSLRNDLPIPEDSVAKIVSDGLLGAAYISIEPGGEEDYMAAGDSFTYTQGAVDLLGLLGQFASGSDAESNSGD